MTLENAEKFVKRFNMTTDKVAYYVIPTDSDPLLSAPIPVTRTFLEEIDEYKMETALQIILDYNSFRLMKKEAGLPKKIPVIEVFAFDPLWGRSATTQNGLFTDIIKVLQ